MFQKERRLSAFVQKFILLALSFFLLLLFISYAHADKVHQLIHALNEPSEACEAAKALADLKSLRPSSH